MQVVYRVSYRNPAEVHANGGFQGTATTVLPQRPGGGNWPAGSFCVATITGLTPDQVKTVLMTYSPPQAIAGHGTPYLYQFEVADADAVLVRTMPTGAFQGVTGGSGEEYVVTAAVASSTISAYISLLNGWQPLGADFRERLTSALLAQNAKKKEEMKE